MFCKKCGNEIANGARFCNYCGNPVELNSAETTVLGQETPPVNLANGETTVLGNQQANVIEQPQPQAAYEQPIYQPAQPQPAYQPPVRPIASQPAKKKLGTGAIIAIVVAALVAIAGIVGGIVYFASNSNDEWVLVLEECRNDVDSDDVAYSHSYEYDSDGRIISEKGTDSWNGDFTVSDYVYDENGNILSKLLTYSDGTIRSYKREYNSNGKWIYFIERWETGGFTDVYEAKGEYDENGNCTVCFIDSYSIGIDDDEPHNKYKCTYEYDEHNNIILSTYYGYDEETNQYYDFSYNIDKSILTYDEDGNCIKAKIVDANKQRIDALYVYEYDENGNKTTELYYEPLIDEEYDDSYSDDTDITDDGQRYRLMDITTYTYAKLKDVAK